jgi:hypothetical protein
MVDICSSAKNEKTFKIGIKANIEGANICALTK